MVDLVLFYFSECQKYFYKLEIFYKEELGKGFYFVIFIAFADSEMYFLEMRNFIYGYTTRWIYFNRISYLISFQRTSHIIHIRK